jgi:predicted HTH domain antitoxin
MTTMLLDDDLLAVLPAVHPGPAEQVRELAVLELYRRRTITSGKAAELLKMERSEFIRYAGRLGVPYIELDEVEVERELTVARVLR